MREIMLDIETLGTSDNALITTISMVQFDLETGEVGSQIELALNWEEQEKNGGIIDAGTVRWWMQQADVAIKAMVNLPTYSVERVIVEIEEWIEAIFGEKVNDVKVWGNGVTFDNTIVRNLYTRHGATFPIPYWGDTDVRTLLALCPTKVKKEVEFVGTQHKGIDDCLYQIKYCTLANQIIKGNK